MKKTRRIIPLLLAIIMVVSMMQVTAFAAADESDMIQLNNQSGKSYSINQGVITLFSPSDGYNGTETIHSGTLWNDNSYREITWTIKDGVGTLRVKGTYYLVNALQFNGGNGLTNVIIELAGSIFTLMLGEKSILGINEEYPTEFAIKANNVNLKIFGVHKEDDSNIFEIRNKSGFFDNAPSAIYTIVVKGGDFVVDGDIYFTTVSVVQNAVTSSATNIYVPEGNVTVEKGVWFKAQSSAHSAAGYNIHTENTITLNGDCEIVSYQDSNPSSVNLNAAAIKIGDGEIGIRNSESAAMLYTVEPTLMDSSDNYQIEIIEADGKTKIVYTYIGISIPEDVQGNDNNNTPFPFTDVLSTDWFYEAVKYLYEHGVTNGTSDTTFSPDMELTRGQFITLIMRAYKVDPDENPVDNFSDAGDTYYTGYLAAAKRLGISDGIGNNMFAPERSLTRQEMCKLLYNLLKMLDKLPENNGVGNAAAFQDSNEMANWAIESMNSFVGAGIITGSDGKLMPCVTTTRAQMTQALYRLLSK